MARAKTAGLTAEAQAVGGLMKDIETTRVLGEALRDGEVAPALDLDALEVRAGEIATGHYSVMRHQRKAGGWYSTQPESDEWRKCREKRVTFYRCGHKGDPVAEGRAAMLRAYGYFDLPDHIRCSGFEMTHFRDINLGAMPQTVEIVDRKRAAKKRKTRERMDKEFESLGGKARSGVETSVFGSQGTASGMSPQQVLAEAQREARRKAGV
jgi:hypothetical protein